MEKNESIDKNSGKEIVEIIEKIIYEREKEITEEDIKEIIQEAIPDIDELISKKIKQHFREISQYIFEKFKIDV